MKKVLLTLLTVTLLIVGPMAASAAGAVSDMANIVTNLNHYPTDADKKVLAAIVADADSTAEEKMLAGALMRMQHRVEGRDAEKLRSLASGKMATAQERELAEILLGITHRPSASDVKRLKMMAP